MKRLLSLLLCAAMLLSCGASKSTGVDPSSYIVAPQTKAIHFQSNPSGAQVIYNGQVLGVTPCTVQVPLNYQWATLDYVAWQNENKENKKNKKNQIGEVEYHNKKIAQASAITVSFVKEGYQSGTETLLPTVTRSDLPTDYTFHAWRVFGGYYFANAQYPDACFHDMGAPVYQQDPTIPVNEATNRVSRDNAGGTALERTVIRWYFDSEPRGARVFWRVISNVPAEVKNTNELFLGTTPFEETRSFNILGLTYVNSRDVQIEVKVSRKGYVDQVKRFNVRQAIDQQEISSFFDLVKE